MADLKADSAGRPQRSDPPPSTPPAVALLVERMLDLEPDSTIYTGSVIQARLKQAEYGNLGPQLIMYSRMIESDTHLSSIIQTRRLTVKKAERAIVPPDGYEDDSKAQAAALYAELLLDRIIGFEDAITTLIDGPVRGFCALEILWDDVVPIALLDTPDGIWKWISGKGLHYQAKNGTWQLVPADKFLIHSPRGNSPQLMRRGAMRPIIKWWLIKNIATRDWASFVELFGIPHRKLAYPTSLSGDDPIVQQVVTALRGMGASGIAAVRKDFDLELMSAAATAGRGYTPHEGLVRWCDAQMSKAVLGQTLTVDTAQATGTYAAAKVHNEVRLDIAQADATGIGEAVKRDLLTPAIGYGLGWDYPVPDYQIIIEDPADEKTRADVLKIAINDLGLPVALSSVYEDLRIREPEEDEELLEASSTSEVPDQFQQPDDDNEKLAATRQLFAADDALGEVPLALETLALLSDREWHEAESMSIPEAINRMIRANPELGNDPQELIRRLNVWYIDHEPSELAEHLVRAMNGGIVNAGLETEAEAELEGGTDAALAT